MSSLDSFFETVKLPSMPEVAHELIKSLGNPKSSASDVSHIVAKDPALTAKLLKLANSAKFGLQRGVGSLDDAIAMVGMGQVRMLALGACMDQAFPTLPGLDRKVFWKNSMTCAGYAQWLATSLDMDGQLAWLTGMMLRLGELLIGQAEPQTLSEIEKLPSSPGDRWAREIKMVGFSEGQITSELARRWHFPIQIVQALQRSANPLSEQAFSRLGAIVHLAGLLADTPNPSAKVLEDLPQDVVAALMLDTQWLSARFPAPNSFMDIS